MNTSIEMLNNLKSDNSSVNSAVKIAVKRMTENKMTEKAQKCITSFLQVASKSNIKFDATIVSKNVYAVEKCRKIVQALTLKNAAYLDKYTQAICINMIKRKTTKTLSNAEFNASLCASIECDSMQATMTKLHKAESTARTQASSTRLALHHFDIAAHNVSEKSSSFNDTKIQQDFVALFTKK